MKVWNGKDLDGDWIITYKVDGVRAIVTHHHHDFADYVQVLSRAGKPLYHLDHLTPGVYEIFAGTWEKSVSAVRTKHGKPVPKEWAYRLDEMDQRLFVCTAVNPSAGLIEQLMKKALAQGYEGLVLHPMNAHDLEDCLKVKPKETYDAQVTKVIPGKGKHLGRMGALMTERGKVGTGFTDIQRVNWATGANGCVIGATIEVEFMGWTPKSKFRHARFLRLREDK